MNHKLSSLLHQQQVYWRQRGAIKWIKLGDENSKLFHANATLRHRRNMIPSLVDLAGDIVYDHSAKANLIWNDFKERLGTSCFDRILFDLVSILF